MENRYEQTLFRWVMLGLGVLAVYKLWQAARRLFWTAFGLGWAVYWTGGISLF